MHLGIPPTPFERRCTPAQIGGRGFGSAALSPTATQALGPSDRPRVGRRSPCEDQTGRSPASSRPTTTDQRPAVPPNLFPGGTGSGPAFPLSECVTPAACRFKEVPAARGACHPKQTGVQLAWPALD